MSNETALFRDASPDATTLLLTASEAAVQCRTTLRTWRSWDAGGLIPGPVRIGRSTFWRADELRAWVDAGCPRRTDWEVLRDPQ